MMMQQEIGHSPQQKCSFQTQKQLFTSNAAVTAITIVLTTVLRIYVETIITIATEDVSSRRIVTARLTVTGITESAAHCTTYVTRIVMSMGIVIIFTTASLIWIAKYFTKASKKIAQAIEIIQ